MNGVELLEKSRMLSQLKIYFDLFQDTVDSFIFAIDVKVGVAMISRRMAEEFDIPGEYLEGFAQVWRSLIYTDDLQNYEAAVGSLLSHEASSMDVMCRVQNHLGEYGWVRFRGRVTQGLDNDEDIFIGNISKMDRALDADPVTGLLSRYAFERDLEATMQRVKDDSETGAVIVIGLDNFQLLQEAFEEDSGDAAMKAIARSIRNILPMNLFLYKLDGDEFGIIWPEAAPEEIDIIFSSIQISLRELKIENDKVFFSVSAGVAFYPDSGTHGLHLQRHAQAALKMAQQQGREQLRFFTEDEYRKWLQFASLQRSFENSIEMGCAGFLLYYQMQVDARTRKIIGAEALLRWEEPTGEIISPLVFIPILERTRMIVPVGYWVVNEAARVCKAWQEKLPGFEMSVNVSIYQLENYDFYEIVRECLAEHDLDPRFLTLELTESQSVSDWDFVNEQFAHLHELGVKVAMDDFGVGYSSLSLLKRFNCDVVKVDKVFVDDILVSEFDRELVKYTVQLCHQAGMEVCIEGVELKEAYEYLADTCKADYIQGFYFGRPEPETVFFEHFSDPERMPTKEELEERARKNENAPSD